MKILNKKVFNTHMQTKSLGVKKTKKKLVFCATQMFELVFPYRYYILQPKYHFI